MMHAAEMLCIIGLALISLLGLTVQATTPPPCNSATFTNFEIASGYCLFHDPSLPYSPNRAAAQQQCRDAQPTATLATGETSEKWNAIHNITQSIGTWVHINAQQFVESADPQDDWVWVIENEKRIVSIPNPEFFNQPKVTPSGLGMGHKYAYISQAAGTTQFADNNELLNMPIICQYLIPGATPTTTDKEGIVEGMAKELQYECLIELNGAPLGSSCYFITPTDATTKNNTECQTDASVDPFNRQAHVYTNELMQQIKNGLPAPLTYPQNYFIGLINQVGDMTGSHWADEDGGTQEHGYRQTDRPDVDGMATTPTSVCSTYSQPNALNVEIDRSTACTDSKKCLQERKVPGQRYTHSANVYYAPNAAVLNTVIESDVRRCAFECLVQRGCLTFNLRVANQTCQLLPVKYTTTADGGSLVLDSGWDYYERIDHIEEI